MIPANVDMINNFEAQSADEKFRILLSIIAEYVEDESKFATSHTPHGTKTPLTDFIHGWMKENSINELELYHWGLSRRMFCARHPGIVFNLRQMIDSFWVWHIVDGIDLCGFYDSLYDLFRSPNHTDRIRRILAKRGYSMIGSGAYSEVWGKEGIEWVYKLNKGEDDEWCEYIVWAAAKGYDSTYAPQVESLKKFGSFYVAKMKKLSKTMREFRENDVTVSPQTEKEYMLFDHVRNCAYSRDMASIDPHRKNKIEKRFPGLIAFFDDLVRNFAQGRSLDLHDGNFMVDKNGFVVVTDPIVGTRGTSMLPRIKRGRVIETAAAA